MRTIARAISPAPYPSPAWTSSTLNATFCIYQAPWQARLNPLFSPATRFGGAGTRELIAVDTLLCRHYALIDPIPYKAVPCKCRGCAGSWHKCLLIHQHVLQLHIVVFGQKEDIK